MGSRWPTAALGDVVQNLDSRRIPLSTMQRRSCQGEYPYYGAAGVIDHVDDYLFEGLHLLVAEDGSVETERGTPVTQLVDGRFWVNNHAHILRAQSDWDTRYLYFAMQTLAVRPYLSGSVQGKLTQQNLNRMRLAWPDEATRRRIASTLGSLDDKIKLNRQMADTLEGIVQTLYSLLVESSEDVDRESPSLCSLADVAVLAKRTVNPQSLPDRVFEHYSLPAFDSGRLPQFQRGEAIKSQKTLVPDGAVLLSKLNPQFPRVWMPELSGEDNAIASTEFLVLTPRRSIPRSFLYCAISSSIFTRRLQAYVTGTSGSHQRVKPQTVMEMPVPCVSRDVLEEFDRLAGPALERASNAIRQGDTLRQMRDALLPPLLDGRIEVPPVADQEVS
ncbi:MAG: restriction endonuclease subunit S [Actinomycetota bacterium]